MNGREQVRRARPGAAAPPERKTLPAWPSPYLISPQFPPGGCLSLTEKTSAAAAAADAGLVFYYYGCHRIILEIDNRNKPAPLVASERPQASAGRVCIDIGSTLCSGRGK